MTDNFAYFHDEKKINQLNTKSDNISIKYDDINMLEICYFPDLYLLVYSWHTLGVTFICFFFNSLYPIRRWLHLDFIWIWKSQIEHETWNLWQIGIIGNPKSQEKSFGLPPTGKVLKWSYFRSVAAMTSEIWSLITKGDGRRGKGKGDTNRVRHQVDRTGPRLKRDDHIGWV